MGKKWGIQRSGMTSFLTYNLESGMKEKIGVSGPVSTHEL